MKKTCDNCNHTEVSKYVRPCLDCSRRGIIDGEDNWEEERDLEIKIPREVAEDFLRFMGEMEAGVVVDRMEGIYPLDNIANVWLSLLILSKEIRKEVDYKPHRSGVC